VAHNCRTNVRQAAAVLSGERDWSSLSPHPFSYLRPPASASLRMFFLTKSNTSQTIKEPASLRSDGVRLQSGTLLGFPSENAFAFAGIRMTGAPAVIGRKIDAFGNFQQEPNP